MFPEIYLITLEHANILDAPESAPPADVSFHSSGLIIYLKFPFSEPQSVVRLLGFRNLCMMERCNNL